MANKEELLTKIDELPLFELRKVQVKTDTNENLDSWELQDKDYAVCKTTSTHSYAYVKERYQLLQFRDIFRPVLEQLSSDVEGYLISYAGFGMLKIFPEMERLREGNDKFGIVAMNSVDCSSAIIVKFIVKRGEQYFYIPPEIAGLRKTHSGNVKNITKDYMSIIGKVKEVWKTIITKFPEIIIVENLNNYSGTNQAMEFGKVAEKLKIGIRLNKKIKNKYLSVTKEGKKYNLWDFITDTIQHISDKKYKEDANREKRIDTVCNQIFKLSFLASL